MQPSRARIYKHREYGVQRARYPSLHPTLFLPFRSGNLDTRISGIGGANRTYFDSAGVLQDGTTNVARFDHLLSDGTSLGLSFWEARTDDIRTNDMTGASTGTPGTAPTNWQLQTGGVTLTINEIGTSNGIKFIEVRWNGTPSGDAGILFETTTGINALTTETWTVSAYMALVAGDFTNITRLIFNQQERTSVGGLVKDNAGIDFKGSLTSTLQRINYTVTLSGGGTTARILPRILIDWDGSGDIDLTLRIGLPTEEKGTGASPVIKTTSAAVTATANFASISPKAIKTTFIAARAGNSGGTQVLWQRDDGTENNRIRIERNSSDEMHFIVTNGGVEQCDLNLGTVADDTDFKVAVRFITDDFAGSLDGALEVTDTGGTIPTITAEFFGVDASENYWNSTIAHFEQQSHGLSNLDLRNLTV